MAQRPDVLSKVLPHLLNLAPYEAAVPPEEMARQAGMPEDKLVKLNANENPYGPSPRVHEALLALGRIHLYPDPAQVLMRNAISNYVGISSKHIVVGNGSDEIIDLVFRSILASGDAIVNCVPTFGMYDFTAQVCGGVSVEVERDRQFEIPVPIAAEAGKSAKAIVLASPNNPSGNSTPLPDIEGMLETGAIVIVDEAYVEFGGTSSVPLVKRYDNLVVLRTMSKWAGLAGLRVGYGIMAPGLADLLLRAKPPYSVSQAAETALLASLEDVDLLNARVASIIQERSRMALALASLEGITPLPSDANFLLCKVPDRHGRSIYEGLASRGVFVRYYARGTLTDYLRISVGTAADTDRVVAALKEILPQPKGI